MVKLGAARKRSWAISSRGTSPIGTSWNGPVGDGLRAEPRARGTEPSGRALSGSPFICRRSTRTPDKRLVALFERSDGGGPQPDLSSAARASSARRAGSRHKVSRGIARRWPYHPASAVLLSRALLGYFASMHESLAAYALLPPGESAPRVRPRTTARGLRGRDAKGSGKNSFFASLLFGHNLQVGIMAMALGVLAGVSTVLLILYNGMMLGAFVAIHIGLGSGPELWAWILPHGITELGAIASLRGNRAAAARAVISPGLKSRPRA